MKLVIIFRHTGWRWLWLAFIVFILDLLSKSWVMTHFVLGESIPVIPFFNVTYVLNPGAAFSFLAQEDGWQRWLLAIIAIGLCSLLLYLMYRTPQQCALLNSGYALVVGGAVGNLFDRVIHGVVIDFIHFHIGHWSFPIFNFADSAICIGAAFIIVDGIFFANQRQRKDSA